MPVLVGNNSIIPAPLVQITSDPAIAGNQNRLGTTYTLTIQGVISAWKGSPNSQGVFWTLGGYPPDEQILAAHRLFSIERKQQALQELFATDGQWLEFVSPDGSTPMKAQFKAAKIEFPQGPWFETAQYTITVITDVIYVNGAIYQGLSFPELIQSASENWDLQEADVVKTFKVSHTVSAIGKKTFDSLGNISRQPWEVAKDFVNERLTVGWNGISTFSNTNGPYIFQNSSLASGTLSFGSFSPYNFSRAERVDELVGSYEVAENWTLAQANVLDIYNVNVSRISQEPYENIRIGIQGTIKGLYTNLFDYDQRNINAQTAWNALQGTSLLNRVQSYTTITLNSNPIAGSIDYNTNEGTINYNYEFSNQLYNGDAFESYTISTKSTAEDYKTSFAIQGFVKGRRYDGDTDQTAAFKRAKVLWNSISLGNTFYNRIVTSKYFPEASGLGLRTPPINKEVSFNESDGTINYSYEFNNRKNDNDINDDNVTEEYGVNRRFSREDGRTYYGIQGSVRGLNVEDNSDPRGTKYALASGYFYNHVLPNLYNRVSSSFNITLPNTNAQVEEIEKNPSLGQISYSYQFWNIPNTILPGALSEVISVTEQNAKGNINVIANLPIPGRTAGPILQNISCTPAKIRSINIEVVFAPTGASNILDAWNLKPDYDSYIAGLQPVGSYTQEDSDTFDWKNGRYHKSVSWIYT